MKSSAEEARVGRGWPGYRAIWRWHFYAGLIAIPFVVWLATTGAIYLFRPQVEAWLDRPYNDLEVTGAPASAQAQVHTALAAVPGSNLHFYQLPTTTRSAVQIIVGRGVEEYRVYVHPQTARVLQSVNEDSRPMTVIFHLHGELLMGDRGSLVVELAASWAIVMIATGLFLWWPRGSKGFGGIVYPRFRQGQRIFWRDLHAVTGVWVSGLALFLLLTGLPWASSWAKYLEAVRSLTHTSGNPDWTSGSAAEAAARLARNPLTGPQSTEHHHNPAADGSLYDGIDTIVAAATPLHLAWPVLIAPPVVSGGLWIAKSDAQNRTLRSRLQLDASGAIVRREGFSQQQWIDRWVETGVAAHEGQLFGLANQLLGLFTALCLITLSISAFVLWWRRRPEKVLGAPVYLAPDKPLAFSFVIVVLAFCIYLPLLGLSVIVVRTLELLILRKIPGCRRWLGLAST
ncbi:MAG: PepSY domain-containing protein [Acidobacteriia bacterium]|nr:PepSY domain-containing protein [Terriglobia bacterium]